MHWVALCVIFEEDHLLSYRAQRHLFQGSQPQWHTWLILSTRVCVCLLVIVLLSKGRSSCTVCLSLRLPFWVTCVALSFTHFVWQLTLLSPSQNNQTSIMLRKYLTHCIRCGFCKSRRVISIDNAVSSGRLSITLFCLKTIALSSHCHFLSLRSWCLLVFWRRERRFRLRATTQRQIHTMESFQNSSITHAHIDTDSHSIKQSHCHGHTLNYSLTNYLIYPVM